LKYFFLKKLNAQIYYLLSAIKNKSLYITVQQFVC